jgi:uracil-DNA glycosylase
MPAVRLTVLVGSYAQAAYLGRGPMTPRVRAFRDFLPELIPLPHPSWRVQFWAAGNPWFADDLLPELRVRVAAALAG